MVGTYCRQQVNLYTRAWTTRTRIYRFQFSKFNQVYRTYRFHLWLCASRLGGQWSIHTQCRSFQLPFCYLTQICVYSYPTYVEISEISIDWLSIVQLASGRASREIKQGSSTQTTCKHVQNEKQASKKKTIPFNTTEPQLN